jgi:hypothetical protein
LDKKLLQAIKNGRVDIFYNSRTWRNKRKEILERALNILTNVDASTFV